MCHKSETRLFSPEENKALNREEQEAGREVLDSNPIRISMDLTGRCNSKCIFCHLKSMDYYTRAEMTPQLFDRLDPFLKTAAHFVYFATAEPLFARHFKEIFEKSAAYEAEKYLSTNAILMKEDIAESFTDNALYYLTISFAGTDRASYRKYHGVDAFDVVMDNIRRLNRIKSRAGKELPHIRLLFVVMQSNAHLLSRAVRMARELDCSQGIKINYLVAYTRELVKEMPYDNIDRVNRHTARAVELADKLGVKVEFDGDDFATVDFKGEAMDHKPCFEAYERFHVEADGKVRICTTAGGSRFVGDIAGDDLRDIWNGKDYRLFRKSVNSKTPPRECKRCLLNMHRDFKRRDIWDLTDYEFNQVYIRKKDCER